MYGSSWTLSSYHVFEKGSFHQRYIDCESKAHNCYLQVTKHDVGCEHTGGSRNMPIPSGKLNTPQVHSGSLRCFVWHSGPLLHCYFKQWMCCIDKLIYPISNNLLVPQCTLTCTLRLTRCVHTQKCYKLMIIESICSHGFAIIFCNWLLDISRDITAECYML